MKTLLAGNTPPLFPEDKRHAWHEVSSFLPGVFLEAHANHIHQGHTQHWCVCVCTVSVCVSVCACASVFVGGRAAIGWAGVVWAWMEDFFWTFISEYFVSRRQIYQQAFVMVLCLHLLHLQKEWRPTHVVHPDYTSFEMYNGPIIAFWTTPESTAFTVVTGCQSKWLTADCLLKNTIE